MPSLIGGDTITCKSGIIGTCGKHPAWEIGGFWTSEKIGANTSFDARPYKAIAPGLARFPVWLGDIDPHVYTVSVSSCSGPSYSFEVNAYPGDLQEISIDLNIYKATIDPIIDGIKTILGLLVPDPKCKWAEGGGKASLQWKEDDKSNLAFFSWQIAVGFMPLFEAEFRLPLGPQVLPEALGKLGNAGFFFEVKGEINIQAEGGQLGPPNSDAGHFDVSTDCSVILAVGGSVFIGAESDPAISVEVAIQTGIEAEFTGKLEDRKPKIEGDVKIGGLKGTCTFHFFFYEKNAECTFFDAKEIWDGPVHLFGDNGPGGGGGGGANL